MLEQIKSAIMAIVATRLNKTHISWDEVESIYDSGQYPDINSEIDYIIYG